MAEQKARKEEKTKREKAEEVAEEARLMQERAKLAGKEMGEMRKEGKTVPEEKP